MSNKTTTPTPRQQALDALLTLLAVCNEADATPPSGVPLYWSSGRHAPWMTLTQMVIDLCGSRAYDDWVATGEAPALLDEGA